MIAADNMCEKDKKLIRKISLSLFFSRMTITRRPKKLSQNIQVVLQDKNNDMVAFSLDINESTDMVDTAVFRVYTRS